MHIDFTGYGKIMRKKSRPSISAAAVAAGGWEGDSRGWNLIWYEGTFIQDAWGRLIGSPAVISGSRSKLGRPGSHIIQLLITLARITISVSDSQCLLVKYSAKRNQYFIIFSHYSTSGWRKRAQEGDVRGEKRGWRCFRETVWGESKSPSHLSHAHYTTHTHTLSTLPKAHIHMGTHIHTPINALKLISVPAVSSVFVSPVVPAETRSYEVISS